MMIKTHITVILPIVLYGCEAWFLTLREKHRLRVFENRMLRKILGPKWHEVTGEWRRLLMTYTYYCVYSTRLLILDRKPVRNM
jgi:hypothetical protein